MKKKIIFTTFTLALLIGLSVGLLSNKRVKADTDDELPSMVINNVNNEYGYQPGITTWSIWEEWSGNQVEASIGTYDTTTGAPTYYITWFRLPIKKSDFINNNNNFNTWVFLLPYIYNGYDLYNTNLITQINNIYMEFGLYISQSDLISHVTNIETSNEIIRQNTKYYYKLDYNLLFDTFGQVNCYFNAFALNTNTIRNYYNDEQGEYVYCVLKFPKAMADIEDQLYTNYDNQALELNGIYYRSVGALNLPLEYLDQAGNKYWYDFGYNNGYDDGMDAGYVMGYEDAFDEIVNGSDAYKQIYEQGYQDGLESNSVQYVGIISRLFGGIGDILTIQVMPHITIGTIIFIPMILALVWVVLKLFRG